MPKKQKKRIGTRPLDEATPKDLAEYDRLDDRLEELDQEIDEKQEKLNELAEKFNAELEKVNVPLLQQKAELEKEIATNHAKYRGSFNQGTKDLQEELGRLRSDWERLTRKHRKLGRKIRGRHPEDDEESNVVPLQPGDEQEPEKPETPAAGQGVDEHPKQDEPVTDKDEDQKPEAPEAPEPTKKLVVKSPEELLKEFRESS